jgi:hypothetical protein
VAGAHDVGLETNPLAGLPAMPNSVMSTALMSIGPSAEVRGRPSVLESRPPSAGRTVTIGLQQDLVAQRRGQADAQPRGLRAHGREVVELARDVDGEPGDRRRVRGGVRDRRADLRVVRGTPWPRTGPACTAAWP